MKRHCTVETTTHTLTRQKNVSCKFDAEIS